MNITKHLNVLKPVHILYSLSIREEDDHCVHLYLGFKRIATFDQGVILNEIHKEADRIVKIIVAYKETETFFCDASEWARDQGWREAA